MMARSCAVAAARHRRSPRSGIFSRACCRPDSMRVPGGAALHDRTRAAERRRPAVRFARRSVARSGASRTGLARGMGSRRPRARGGAAGDGAAGAGRSTESRMPSESELRRALREADARLFEQLTPVIVQQIDVQPAQPRSMGAGRLPGRRRRADGRRRVHAPRPPAARRTQTTPAGRGDGAAAATAG